MFWGLTDRGPNDEALRDGRKVRLIHLPGYAPALLRLRVIRGVLRVEEALFLRTPDGRPVTGLPNLAAHDEEAWDAAEERRLAFDPSGVDPEALVRTRDGFLLAEEYAPSLLRVNGAGRVLARYVPRGLGLAGAAYPVRETLPALFARRRQNRGFESLAMTPDAKRVYAIAQSPLLHPDEATGEASRMLRVLALDAASLEPLAEHVIVAEAATAFGGVDQSELKVSDATALSASALLIDECVDGWAKVFRVEFTKATNLLGSRFDDPEARPTLESLRPEELAAHGISPAEKSLVADLKAIVPDLPAKIEGLTLLDERTLVFGNDNEFGVRERPEQSMLFFVRLTRSLK